MSETILGLDLGANSFGWALLNKNEEGEYAGIIASGVRIFEAGMDGDIASGKAESRAVNRRLKRQVRRMLVRRRRRMLRIKHLLQRHGFLPQVEDLGKEFAAFDAALIQKFRDSGAADLPPVAILPHTLPYYLRARALDRPLTPHEFGRAIYHLSQRRGFLSNRRTPRGQEDGQVKQGIAELQQKMTAAHARTLGEYFAQINPEQEKLRRQWTAREMFVTEFNLICDAQQALFTPDFRKELEYVIFHQRPLRSAAGLVGRCQLENRRRCSWSRPEAQEFRLLQSLNNLQILVPDQGARELAPAERQLLIPALYGLTGMLDHDGKLAVGKAKKLLKLSKGCTFSVEAGGEKYLPGHAINARLVAILGDRWARMPESGQEMFLDDMRSFEKEAAFRKRLEVFWQLPSELAAAVAEELLPDGYCALSRPALLKLLPEMRNAVPYMTAVKKLYPEQFSSGGVALPLLPAADEIVSDLRNPAVHRALSETRKTVNAVIRRYGKPDLIRLELARELKTTNEQKKNAIARMRAAETAREKAKQRIVAETPISNPSSDDILKMLLAEECNWLCPYTGKAISMHSLLVESQFDIEHIIPFSRSLDNSFANKTLCYHDENRHGKGNRTPFEAYAADTGNYRRILADVGRFQGPAAAEKLRRFKLDNTDEFEDFTSRQLNDSRYAAKLSRLYLGSLYGGVVDNAGRMRVQTMTGGITSNIRIALGLNRIIGNGEKNRGDHRHHAVDAVAIALTGPDTVKMFADFFKDPTRARWEHFRVSFKEALKLPAWPSHYEAVRASIREIIVSHGVGRKARGPFHQETLYSRNFRHKDAQGKAVEVKHIRKPLAALSADNVAQIVDPAVRDAVAAKLVELGIKDPAKAFAAIVNLPVLPRRDDRPGTVIRYAKIAAAQETRRIGRGDRAREVVTGNNHHMEIYAVLDAQGNEIRWEGEVVSLFDARQRLKRGEPLVRRDFGPDRRFKFSLCCGDIIQVKDITGCPVLRIVRTVPQSRQLMFVDLKDARMQKEIKEAKQWYSLMPDGLRKMQTEKFTVTPIGELRRAHD